ncbi:hypothetical protein WFP14_10170 [Yersinia proxima]|uniref:Phage abortive infection protein n=1 Tax=Yersinia proxima TaxID=2890316 RepID=A0ABW9EYS3_9GAMM
MKLLFLFLFLILAPILPYAFFFSGKEISQSSADWGSFGSYLGGAYAMCSIAVLAYTLYLTQKNNISQTSLMNEQINLIRKEQKNNEMLTLIGFLKETYNNNFSINKLGGIYPLESLDLLDQYVIDQINSFDAETIYYPDSFYNAVDNAIYRATRKYNVSLESETILFARILINLDELDDNDNEKYKKMISGLLTNQQRFWLESYAKRRSIEVKFYISKWHDFSAPTEKIQELLNNYEYGDEDRYNEE